MNRDQSEERKKMSKQREDHEKKPIKENHQSKRNVPEIYDELKKQANYGLTPTGKAGVKEQAKERKISASEFVERIGREDLKVVLPEEWALIQELGIEKADEVKES